MIGDPRGLQVGHALSAQPLVREGGLNRDGGKIEVLQPPFRPLSGFCIPVPRGFNCRGLEVGVQRVPLGNSEAMKPGVRRADPSNSVRFFAAGGLAAVPAARGVWVRSPRRPWVTSSLAFAATELIRFVIAARDTTTRRPRRCPSYPGGHRARPGVESSLCAGLPVGLHRWTPPPCGEIRCLRTTRVPGSPDLFGLRAASRSFSDWAYQ